MNKIELADYGRRIAARNETIDGLEKALLKGGNAWLCEIRLQGHDLLAVKPSVPHGQWEKYLTDACKLHPRTAQRRMLIAKTSHESDLTEAGSLREALAICDAPMEPKDANKTNPQSWPTYMEGIARASKFVGLLERFPIAKWPAAGVTKLRTDLEPIARQLWPEKFS